jgi:hypothetical protein
LPPPVLDEELVEPDVEVEPVVELDEPVLPLEELLLELDDEELELELDELVELLDEELDPVDPVVELEESPAPVSICPGTLTKKASTRAPPVLLVQIKYWPVTSRLPFGSLL